MKILSASTSPLQALAAHWRVLGLMAVVLARHISLSQKMKARAGVDKADLLEAWLFAAIVQLAEEIAEHSAGGEPRRKADQAALQHLKAIYIALMVLARLTANMRMKLALPHWAKPFLPFAPNEHRHTGPISPVTILDSS